MVAASVAVVAVAIYRRSEDPASAIPPGPEQQRAGINAPADKAGSAVPEKPWLSAEATDQIATKDGTPGPLFAGIELGGPAPSDATRAKIAELARSNDVDLAVDVADGKVAAVRFGVTYGGCCGYEGVDKIADRFGRPTWERYEGGKKEYADDWTFVHDKVHGRARARINHFEVRWERATSVAEFVEHIDGMIGKDAVKTDRWHEIEAGRRYLIEMPTPITQYPVDGKTEERFDLGVAVTLEAGRIHEIVYPIDRHVLDNEDALREYKAAFRAHWGAPAVHKSESEMDWWSWDTANRSVIVHFWSQLEIRGRP